MDRIKLTTILLERVMNTISVKRAKMLIEDFPLHNRFMLHGEKKFTDKDKVTIKADLPKGKKIKNPEMFEEKIPIGLSKTWSNWLKVPSTDIRNYFGEKIAMYFSFLSVYTMWLVAPAVLGVPIFII